MDPICSTEPCPVILNSTCVFYEGANLLYTGINTNDSIQTALQKIDAKFQEAAIGYLFNNGVFQSGPGLPVGLGGTMDHDTIITAAGFDLTYTGDLYCRIQCICILVWLGVSRGFGLGLVSVFVLVEVLV